MSSRYVSSYLYCIIQSYLDILGIQIDPHDFQTTELATVVHILKAYATNLDKPSVSVLCPYLQKEKEVSYACPNTPN